MQAFGGRDAPFFFGREKAAAEIRARLTRALDQPQPLVVSGTSGAGKTSLLCAGVLADASDAPDTQAWPHQVIVTPARSPLDELATAVAALYGADPTTLRESMRRDGPALARAARAAMLHRDSASADGAGRLLIVVDQFEQLFTQCDDEAERRAFVAALHAAATWRQGPEQVPAALVVLVVRADFEARCAEFREELAQPVQDRYLVTPMTDVELRRAITGPLEIVDAQADADLIDLLLAEMRGSSAARLLPHLSHALDQAWRARAEENRLSLSDYLGVDGITGSIAASADRTYQRLTDDQKAAAQPVFMRLVTTSSDLVVSAGRATRAELEAGARGRDVTAVVEAFAAERLLTLGEDYVEISHEVLLTEWAQLRSWLDGDRVDMARYSRLSYDARAWDADKRPSSQVYSPARLAEVDAAVKRWDSLPGRYPALAPDALAFLDAARRAARRARRLRRGVIAVLSALTLAATTTAALTVYYASSTDQQHSIAISNALVGQSLSIAGSDPVAAEQLAVAAWHEWPTPQAAAAMSTLLAQQERSGTLPVSPLGDESYLRYLSTTPSTIAFSPDGSLIATAQVGNTGGEIQLWSADRETPVGPLLDVGASGVVGVVGVVRMAFSPDGRLLANTEFDRIELWNPRSGKLIRTLEPLYGAPPKNGTPLSDYELAGVAFSPNAELVAGVSVNGVVYLWDTGTGTEVGTLLPRSTPMPLPGGRVIRGSVAFSPDGKLLASTYGAGLGGPYGGGYVQLWDVTTGKPVGAPAAVAAGALREAVTVAFSPGGSLFVCGGGGYGQVRYSSAQGITAQPQLVRLRLAGVATMSADASRLVTSNADGSLELWNPATGKEIGKPLPVAPGGGLADTAISPATGLVATVDADGTVQLWNTAAGKPLGATLTGSYGQLFRFSPRADLLTAGADGYLKQLPDPTTPQQAAAQATARDTWMADSGDSVSQNGTVSAISDGNDVQLSIATPAGIRIKFLPAAPGDSNSVAMNVVSPNGELLATTDFTSGNVTLWNTATGTRIGKPLPVDANYAAFSPDGTLLATADYVGNLAFWNTRTGSPAGVSISSAAGSASPNAIAFSPDGRLLAIANSDGIVSLYDPVTGGLAATLAPGTPGEVNGATALAFSPDGRLLAVGYSDGTIQLWNPATAATIGGSLPPSNASDSAAGIDALAFSPDGSLLLSSYSNDDVEPWQTWLVANPYAALCDEAGPPSASVWSYYEPAVQEPAGTCAGVPPATALGG